MNFHEKALFVKPMWRPPEVDERTGSLCPSRYASIRTREELTLFSVARCIMGSFFSGYRGSAAIFASVSPPKGADQVHLAQSPSIRSEAMGHHKPRRSPLHDRDCSRLAPPFFASRAVSFS
jgi:hypothetical protein